MTEHRLPSAVTGTEMRLDVLIALQSQILDRLTPAAIPEPEPVTEPATIELREPETPAMPVAPKAKRR